MAWYQVIEGREKEGGEGREEIRGGSVTARKS